MKKIIVSILSLVLFVPRVLAATIVSDFQTVLDRNESREMAPIIITSTSGGDITAEHGIRILLATEYKVLFGDADLTITGSAMNNGKVNLNVQAEYTSDRKSVFIPVMDDFEAGEWLSVQGLVLRAYDEGFGEQMLGLDLDGDSDAEVSDINTYKVATTSKSDFTAPFPVLDAAYIVNASGSVTLTWNQPPDYDYDGTIINRTRVKNGFTQTGTVYNDFSTTYTDTDLTGVTSLSYSIIAKDGVGNQGEAVIVVVDLTEPEDEPAEEPVEPTEEVEVPETEVNEMSRLLNYYNVRYSIKCMPSGVAVAENNSACLWARIDLIYAQEGTGEERVAGLALSARDLELMQTRRRWPEMRYEDNCITAAEPASYCSALGKALDRISYFLD